jgi:hypothetical protein
MMLSSQQQQQLLEHQLPYPLLRLLLLLLPLHGRLLPRMGCAAQH